MSGFDEEGGVVNVEDTFVLDTAVLDNRDYWKTDVDLDYYFGTDAGRKELDERQEEINRLITTLAGLEAQIETLEAQKMSDEEQQKLRDEIDIMKAQYDLDYAFMLGFEKGAPDVTVQQQMDINELMAGAGIGVIIVLVLAIGIMVVSS